MARQATKEIECNDFARAVSEVIEDYFDNITSGGNELVASTAVECVQELKRTSPRDKGDYANGWTIKYTKKLKRDQEIIIHNAPCYRLTHLLEWGHLKVVHNTVLGFTSGQPHIMIAEKNAIHSLENGFSMIIKD